MVVDDQMMRPFTGQYGRELDPEAAFAAAESEIQRNSKTFYLATSLLPRPQRRAIRALYAFCRASDDLVDLGGTTHEDVERWRARVRLPSSAQRDPLLYVWALTREQYGVDPRYESELISGVASDLEAQTFSTWAELEDYCYHVASTVGLLSMPILELRPGVTFQQAAPYAIRLGIALQLTNILRDIGEDAARGKVYLPEDHLRRFGLTRCDILRGVYDERFINLMKYEIELAHRLYREALPGVALLSREGRLAVGAAAMLYRAILDEIATIRFRVYQVRAHTSGWKKLALLPGILFTTFSLRPPVSGQGDIG